jgi:hypothetical protein
MANATGRSIPSGLWGVGLVRATDYGDETEYVADFTDQVSALAD